jgi:hypothetical protein
MANFNAQLVERGISNGYAIQDIGRAQMTKFNKKHGKQVVTSYIDKNLITKQGDNK